MKNLIPFLLIIPALISCSDDETVDQRAVDQEIITTYIADNSLTAMSTASGLYYVIDNQGTGAQPTSTSQVTVNYSGYFTDGSTFDEGDGITFSLSQVIEGWQEGIPLFNVGGSGTLLIPSHLAYGERGIPGAIPPNTVLLFDIELLATSQ